MQLPLILNTFNDHGVRFVAVGHTALFLHGSLETLRSAQLCFHQEWNNCECIGQAVEELGGTPLGQSSYPAALTGQLRQTSVPIRLSLAETELELWPRVPGLGDYEDLLPRSATLKAAAIPVRALSIEQLIRWLQLNGEGEEGAELLTRLGVGEKPLFSPNQR